MTSCLSRCRLSTRASSPQPLPMMTPRCCLVCPLRRLPVRWCSPLLVRLRQIPLPILLRSLSLLLVLQSPSTGFSSRSQPNRSPPLFRWSLLGNSSPAAFRIQRKSSGSHASKVSWIVRPLPLWRTRFQSSVMQPTTSTASM